MPKRPATDGQPPDGERTFHLYAARRLGPCLLVASLYTAAVNVLALTGPAYMLLLYGGPPSGHAAPNLVVLTLVMLALYALGAWLDVIRQKHLLRAARRIDRQLHAVAARKLRPFPVRDIHGIGSFLRGHGPAALCDLPWVPLYLALMFFLHPLFGVLALAGTALLVGALFAAERGSAAPARRLARTAEDYRRTIASAAPPRTLLAAGARLRAEHEAAARPSMVSGAVVRALRPALQSAVLGLGVYLSMTGNCPTGSALAASIILPRILGPLEMALAHWRSLSAAHAGAARLHALLTSPQRAPPRAVELPQQGVTSPGVRIVLRRANG